MKYRYLKQFVLFIGRPDYDYVIRSKPSHRSAAAAPLPLVSNMGPPACILLPLSDQDPADDDEGRGRRLRMTVSGQQHDTFRGQFM